MPPISRPRVDPVRGERPPGRSGRPSLARCAGLVLIAGFALTGVSASSATASTEPPTGVFDALITTTDEPGPEVEPAAPPEPDPAPDPSPDPTPEPDEGDETDEAREIPWGTVFVISIVLLIVLALLAVISAMIHRRPSPAVPRPTDAQRALGDVRWLHDQLSLDVLSGQAETARSRWLGQRPIVDAMARDAQQRAAAEPRAGWSDLAEEIARLTRALDTATAVRADPTTDPSVVSEAIAVVNQARQDVLVRIDETRRRTRR